MNLEKINLVVLVVLLIIVINIPIGIFIDASNHKLV